MEPEKEVYIVTNGTYSEYEIMGVFTNETNAENFRLKYNYTRVEPHPIDSQVHERPDLLPYMISFYHRFYCIAKHVVCRVPVGTQPHKWLTRPPFYGCKDFNNPTYVFLAKDDKHAEKVAGEKVAMFKSGVTFATCKYIKETTQEEHTATLRFNEGKLEVLYDEPTSKERKP